MRNNSRTNYLIRNIVIGCDFIVLNLLWLVLYKCDPHLGPMLLGMPFIAIWLMSNIALVLAEWNFPTVVHLRRMHFRSVVKRVTILCFAFFVIFLLLTKGTCYVFSMHSPQAAIYWRFTIWFYFLIIISRAGELIAIKYYRSRGGNQRSAVLVGCDPVLLQVYHELVDDPTVGYKVLGYYSGMSLQGSDGLIDKLGGLSDLREAIADGTLQGDEIYCSLPWARKDVLHDVMEYCDNNVRHFYVIPVTVEMIDVPLKNERLGDINVFTNIETPLQNPTNRFLKRVFDVVLSSIVLICMLPFAPIIALIIKLSSPGPILFKQKRTGMNGREFWCYKFRSMHINKDADKLQATKDDPRKFAFGNFMRKTNIDELPQFWNVLRGTMSVVGPRPHMLAHTDFYGKRISHYMVRHFVKPGITGWAQVTGFRGETKELWQMEGRVRRDIWYIEHWSFWLDLRIILLTAKQVIVHDKNAY